MGQTLYSQLKPAWHNDHLEEMRAGRIPRPVHVQLILSDLCNQDCHFCAYRMSTGLSSELFAVGPLAKVGTNNPKRQIPTGKACEIVDDCAELGVKAIQFTGGGEPTVHPYHRLIIARAQKLGMDTALVTNGLLLKPTDPAILGLKWIRVSIDAGDAKTYAQVRRVPEEHWNKVWANVEALASQYQGTLGVGFVITPENYTGIAAAAHRANMSGAANMRVGAVFSEEGLGFYGKGLIPKIREVIAEAKAQVDGGGFELIDLFGRRLGDLDHGNPDDPECYYQYLTMYIGGDLSVYRCCNTAYTRAGDVGSLVDMRLRDFVPKYLPFDARACQFCQFIGQNKGIKALVEEPDHVNFV